MRTIGLILSSSLNSLEGVRGFQKDKTDRHFMMTRHANTYGEEEKTCLHNEDKVFQNRLRTKQAGT